MLRCNREIFESVSEMFKGRTFDRFSLPAVKHDFVHLLGTVFRLGVTISKLNLGEHLIVTHTYTAKSAGNIRGYFKGKGKVLSMWYLYRGKSNY